jgi:hypothetical protein
LWYLSGGFIGPLPANLKAAVVERTPVLVSHPVMPPLAIQITVKKSDSCLRGRSIIQKELNVGDRHFIHLQSERFTVNAQAES